MIDRDDPRLTAYALGEMNATEQADFEKILALDPSAQAEVAAIRALGGKLFAELASSAAPALTDAQRASVAKAARRRVPLLVLLMPVAACLIVAVSFLATRGEKRVFEARAPRIEAEKRAKTDAEERARQNAPNDPEAPAGFRGPNGVVQPGVRTPVAKPEELQFNPPQITLKGVDSDESAPLVAKPAESPKAESAKAMLTVNAATTGSPVPLQAPSTPAGAVGAVGFEVKDGRAPDAFSKSKEETLRRLEERLSDRASQGDREGYDRIRENPFVRVSEEDSSTFSIDVDTASYSNVRRFLQQQHQLPPADAVRIEEMVNYFSYAYEPPAAGSPHPFRVHVEVAQCPWDATHRLARVAIKGKTIDRRERPASNLVFLVDVSGSMDEPNKLPLVQASLRLLAGNLGEKDRVAIVVYAGAAGLVLPSTGDKDAVVDALNRLRAGGSTAGAAGIALAYQVAAENFIKDGVNRVILCTDGDFNVGISDDGSLTRFIEEKAKTGVFLSVLGFGTGNYQDAKMQSLADKGNGNHAYIDSIMEARKVLGEEMSGTLVTIAKDVKIQIFFNPRKVAGFRLIGYENRMLAKQDFNDDTKDAGEIGAGHSVTALYELVPAGSEVPAAPAVDENPFLAKAQATVDSDALFQLKLRYKQPDGDTSQLLAEMVRDGGGSYDGASADFRWAAAVAAFGMNLRGTAGMGLDAVLEISRGAAGDDKYRREFLELVETAKLLKR